MNSGTVRRLLKIISSHAGKFLPKLVTDTVAQVGQRYVSHEAVFLVSQSDYVPGGTVFNLKDYDEQSNII